MMRYIVPILIALAVGHMGATLVNAAHVEVKVQYSEAGSDTEYVHGKHCIDGRAF